MIRLSRSQGFSRSRRRPSTRASIAVVNWFTRFDKVPLDAQINEYLEVGDVESYQKGVIEIKKFRYLYALILFVFAGHALAIDADGFFIAKSMDKFFGEPATETTNGMVRALWKIDSGALKVCIEKKQSSKDCDAQWVTPAQAVEKLIEDACYLGFDNNIDILVFYYRINRSCG